ncbi:MAG: membrane dipeptidase, partial [Clostridia bacterium]|nr:membrane dipeptidase [Clostridia bacterium]
MKLTDLHCDTLYRMAKENLTIDDHSLHIHRRTIDAFDDVWQVFALWSDRRVDDHTAWVELKERYALLKSLSLPSHLTPLLAVEDARLLEGDLTRLCELKAMGFLMLGFFWSGENQLGTAHDCPHRGGLTSFGYQVLQNCFSLGICPDISHASFDSAEDMIRLAEAQKMPLCASHSAFFGVHPHTRNITDEHAKRVAQLGGAVGLCFVPAHLGGKGLEKVASHIRHGVSL